LAQNRSSDKLVSIFSADKICSLQENGSTIVPRQAFPFFLGGECTIDGFRDGSFICLVVGAEMTGVIMRQGLFCDVARLDLREGLGSGLADKDHKNKHLPVGRL